MKSDRAEDKHHHHLHLGLRKTPSPDNGRALLAALLPYGDGGCKLFGMENFGNTCYCNSILQCLYYTTKFRQNVLAHNTKPHDRRIKTNGFNPHSYLLKYEQLLAKKLKEQGKGPEAPAPPQQAVPLSPGAATMGGPMGAPPARPLIRNSIFGKFTTQLAHQIETKSSMDYRKLGFIQDLRACSALLFEQRLLINRTPEIHHMEVLVTRPEEKNRDLKDPKDPKAESEDTPAAEIEYGPESTRSSIVMVGIPKPEFQLATPLNPFSANPTTDHRKRSALINGPILNVDYAFVSSYAESDETCLLYSLKDIFEAMCEHSSQTGVVSPSFFILKLKLKNILFRQANMHHDAHEFCNYLVNEILETLNLETSSTNNWCTDLFQGIITNETKCLSCESVTSKEETFLDLPVDIPPGNSAYSLTHALNNFSKLETLNHQNKFYCNTCLLLQEAVKTIKLKKTPEILVINFKRFKYDPKLDRMVKLFDCILYPMNLRLFNTTDQKSANGNDQQSSFTLYRLYGLVVHIGGGPMHGHYVALCRAQLGLWFLFDDETVELVEESYVLRFFGNGPGLACAYILFYEKLDTSVDGDDFGIDIDNVYDGDDYLRATSDATHTEEHSLKSEEKSLGKTASILKKTFMFDQPQSTPSKDTKNPEVGSPKAEKKSWVDGLKRRETKTDMSRDRKSSVSSIGSVPAPAEEETVKRRGSIFSFKKKNKS